MKKIVKIESARHMYGTYWKIGRCVEYNEELVITEIKDMTADIADQQIHVQYDIYVNNQLYMSLINMPVMVVYELHDAAV